MQYSFWECIYSSSLEFQLPDTKLQANTFPYRRKITDRTSGKQSLGHVMTVNDERR